MPKLLTTSGVVPDLHERQDGGGITVGVFHQGQLGAEPVGRREAMVGRHDAFRSRSASSSRPSGEFAGSRTLREPGAGHVVKVGVIGRCPRVARTTRGLGPGGRRHRNSAPSRVARRPVGSGFGIGIDRGARISACIRGRSRSLRTSVSEAASPPASRVARSKEASAAIAPSARGDETSQLQGPHRDLRTRRSRVGIEAGLVIVASDEDSPPHAASTVESVTNAAPQGRRKTGLMEFTGNRAPRARAKTRGDRLRTGAWSGRDIGLALP